MHMKKLFLNSRFWIVQPLRKDFSSIITQLKVATKDLELISIE